MSRGGLRLVRLGVDVPLLLTLLTLVVFGLLILYSASWDFSRAITEDKDPNYIFNRQLLWLVLGLGGAAVMVFLNYRWWEKLAIPAMALTIITLIFVLVIAEVRLGAARTISEGSYQPSELAKLITVIYLSVWLHAKRDYFNQLGFGLIPMAVILGIVGGLIYAQPDVSAVLTVVLLGALMFFLAGGDMKQILIVIAVTFVVGWIVVMANETGQTRVEAYWLGVQDPTAAPYHVQRSLEAFVKGGWFGVGIGKADTKHTGLPVPPTDSIFAVIGEETGVIGSVFTLGLYTMLLWRGMEIARRAPDLLGSLLAGGLSLWVAMEAYINMAVILGLIPFAGNALPFVSSGGSSLVSSLIAMGIVMNVSRVSEQAVRDQSGRTSEAIDFGLRRDERPPRWTASKPTSKPVGEFREKQITSPMAKRDPKTRRQKRARNG
ncbi:MAG TPA: FtsW/RodA/SpoVE family cell cycle protein [Anaerolineales bacterium]|nr:FtsW/RodA/SpoVE family cell cycle protein [Anaerolineales bacterium]